MAGAGAVHAIARDSETEGKGSRAVLTEVAADGHEKVDWGAVGLEEVVQGRELSMNWSTEIEIENEKEVEKGAVADVMRKV